LRWGEAEEGGRERELEREREREAVAGLGTWKPFSTLGPCGP